MVADRLAVAQAADAVRRVAATSGHAEIALQHGPGFSWTPLDGRFLKSRNRKDMKGTKEHEGRALTTD
jgi:hypothetical protein